MLNPKFADVTQDVETFISPYRGKDNIDETLKKLVEEIGFEEIIIKIEDKHFSFYGAENFKGCLIHSLIQFKCKTKIILYQFKVL